MKVIPFPKITPYRLNTIYPKISIGAVILFLFLSGCSGSLASDVTPPPDYQPTRSISTVDPAETLNLFPLLPPDPTAGKNIYLEKCAPCHGNSGLGDGVQAANLPTLPPSVGTLDQSRKVSPAAWFQIVTRGNIENFMPGFGASLSDRQRWDVVAYLLTLSINPDQMENGRQLYQANCLACHGENGAGIDGKAPTLDREIVLQKSLDDLSLIISRGKGTMPPVARQMTETQQLDTAAFIRSLAFAPQPALPSNEQQAAIVTPAPVVTESETPSVGTGLVISGTVVNGSGETMKPGLQLELTGYDSTQAVYTETSETNAEGRFSFTNIPDVADRVYQITTNYKGNTFTSDAIHPDQINDLPLTIITVYETSTDTSQFRAERLHLFFEFLKPDVVQVVQMYVVNNPTNYLITAEKPGVPVIDFPLPAGASNLEFQNGTLGERFILTPDGFGDTQGIPPGSGTQILFAYDLPYGTDLHLKIKVPLMVETSNIMLPSRGVTIKSNQIQDMGEKNIQGSAWRIYSSGVLLTGTNLEMLLTGKPEVTRTEESEQSMNLTIGFIALGLALMVVGVVGFNWNSSKKQIQPVKTSTHLDGVNTDALLDAIIALDDLHQSGQIPRSAYEERRAELKDRLRGVKDFRG